MHDNHQQQTAASLSGDEIPEVLCPRPIYPDRNKLERVRRMGPTMEKEVMELRVQLKVCEGCGCLWFRPQSQLTVYCQGCDEKLKDFPTPESRKRRGRPSRKAPARVFASVENNIAMGGLQ
jgi:hypothetical protein